MAKQFLRLPEVELKTGCPRSSIYRYIKAGTFPSPVKIGPRASAWDSEMIENWMDDAIDTSKQANDQQ
jgi:prophage regulatory protein